MEEAKRRSPVIAALLSLVLPGLGQMYNGKFLRGALLHCGFWLALIGMGLCGLALSLYGLIAIATTAAVVQVLIAIDAAIGARRANASSLRWYNRWWAYVGVTLCAGLILDPVIAWSGQFHIVMSKCYEVVYSIVDQKAVEEGARFPFAGLKAYRMPASSMIPTLEVGDHFLAKLERYGDRPPARGDIVIFPYPVDTTKDFIKRVIGLPGEELEIKDKAVFINGRRLDDPWGVHKDGFVAPPGAFPRDNMGPITVPPNSVFVLGDNRDFSHDSRFWGFVEIKEIEGKALFIYYSNDLGRIGKQIK